MCDTAAAAAPQISTRDTKKERKKAQWVSEWVVFNSAAAAAADSRDEQIGHWPIAQTHTHTLTQSLLAPVTLGQQAIQTDGEKLSEQYSTVSLVLQRDDRADRQTD